jgi:hypothetical protein
MKRYYFYLASFNGSGQRVMVTYRNTERTVYTRHYHHVTRSSMNRLSNYFYNISGTGFLK